MKSVALGLVVLLVTSGCVMIVEIGSNNDFGSHNILAASRAVTADDSVIGQKMVDGGRVRVAGDIKQPSATPGTSSSNEASIVSNAQPVEYETEPYVAILSRNKIVSFNILGASRPVSASGGNVVTDFKGGGTVDAEAKLTVPIVP